MIYLSAGLRRLEPKIPMLFTIPAHPDNRHVFAFMMPGLGQLQPTRMPQGTSAASFTLNAREGIVFEPIPEPKSEPSLLDEVDYKSLPPLMYGMDDILGDTEQSFKKTSASNISQDWLNLTKNLILHYY